MKDAVHGPGDGPDDPGAEVIRIAAPPRPRRFDCLIMLLLVPMLNCWNLIVMALVAAAEELLRAAGLPRELGLVMGVGSWALMLAVIGLLLHAHQTRWRAATVERDRVIIGTLDPPRGLLLRFDRLAGFRCAAAGVVLVVRGKPWTRWLGPLIACDGKVMHHVVERLEAQGVRRIDG